MARWSAGPWTLPAARKGATAAHRDAIMFLVMLARSVWLNGAVYAAGRDATANFWKDSGRQVAEVFLPGAGHHLPDHPYRSQACTQPSHRRDGPCRDAGRQLSKTGVWASS